jgi:drug/metabolite transporter (DMT)-like permease
MNRPAARLQGYDILLYALVVFAWGTSWIGIHLQAVSSVPPEVSVFWRFLLAGLVMLGLALARGERLALPLRAHGLFLPMGLPLFSAFLVLFYHGALEISSGLLSVVFSMASVVNLALAYLFFGQKLELRVLAGAGIGMLGVALLFGPQIFNVDLGGATLAGLTFSVLGTLCFCCGNMLSFASQRSGVPVIAGTAWGMLYGVGWLAAYCLARGYSFMPEFSAVYLGSLAFVVLSASVLAFWAYLTLLGRIGAGRAGYATVMFPVVALAISTIAEGYVWTPLALVGVALALGGNVLVLRR